MCLKTGVKKSTGTVKVDRKTGFVKRSIIRDTEGRYTLVVWVEKETISLVRIEIAK